MPEDPALQDDKPRALFEGRDLACRRGGRMVFEGLDFSLAAGGALLLTGPNGSGKSSLLRLMAGFLRPNEGALTWAGAALSADPEAHRERLHFLGHLDAVKPVLTARENLAFWTGLRNGAAAPLDEALERFGLTAQAETPGRQLSAGQKRRLALARLLTARADLWLLDEPGVGLDTASLALLDDAVAAHRAAGGSVVASTHMPLPFGDTESLALDDFEPQSREEYLW